MKTKPRGGTQGSCRTIAAETKLSKSTLQRVWKALWKAFGLPPHRPKHFKISTDPFFVEKVRDLIGLSLNPPDHAVVLCVDEKSPIQALDRTQPSLPMGLGDVEGGPHGSVRHGTTTLCAALDVASGPVRAKCKPRLKPRPRHQECLAFLRDIDKSVPKKLDVHRVVDHSAPHTHASVRRGLAARPRFPIHSTPTDSSWLNQVEIGFHIIPQKAIRRGPFRSVRDLTQKIEAFIENDNRNCRPFAGRATSDSIFEKLERLSKAIAGTRH